MLCARCQKKPATFVVKSIVDNQVSEAHLCMDCAHEEGAGAVPPGLAGLLALLGGAPAVRERPAPARCPGCGLRWAEFRKTGFLGCPACYDAFAEGLKGLLKEMQGAAKHGGKTPAHAARSMDAKKRSDEAASLRRRLDEAVRREDFEEAARLRDQLRRLRG